MMASHVLSNTSSAMGEWTVLMGVMKKLQDVMLQRLVSFSSYTENVYSFARSTNQDFVEHI